LRKESRIKSDHFAEAPYNSLADDFVFHELELQTPYHRRCDVA
jgi:hypothetical protein